MIMENIKTNEPNNFLANLSQRLDLRNSNKHVFLQNSSIYYTWKNKLQEKKYKNKKIKIFAPMWNDELELTDCLILCQVFKIILSTSSESTK